jgi:transcriptional regulator
MYVPNHFKEENIEKLHQYIRTYNFGLLIIADDQGIEANHVPFLLSVESDNRLGQLECHLARNNSAWQRIQAGARVLVVFQGPNAYISPSWYPTKAENGFVVPTWNYFAIHVEGKAQVIEDPIWLKRHLRQLTEQHEANRDEPWSVEDAPTDFTSHLMQAIVGIEINIETLTGKLKASQNQPAQNRESVKAGLQFEEGKPRLTMSDLIEY